MKWDKVRSWILRAGLTCYILMLTWIVPPAIHKALHYCPVRPDGISEASAIPAFARKYGVSCSVCHVPSFPKLNDYGNTFRDHGYQLDTDEDLPTSKNLSPAYFPVSFRTTVGYQYANVGSERSGLSSGGFGFTGLDILSFGILDRDISYGVVYTPALESAGFNLGPSAGDLEAAYVRLDNLNKHIKLGGLDKHPYLVNLKVGKFEPDIPFSEHRSTTLNTQYVMYHYKAGEPYQGTLSGISSHPGYANPNDYALGDNQSGAELSGMVKTGEGDFRYSGMAFSNSNSNVAGSGGGHHTNFYGHVTQSFGGYGIVKGQRIGVFGAYGETPTAPNPACATPPCHGTGGAGRAFSRIGADLSLTFMEEFNLFGAVMHAKDSTGLFDPTVIIGARSATWNGAFVQLDWAPSLLPLADLPDWLLSYRYDIIRNERQADPFIARKFNDVDSHTWMVRYAFHKSPRNGMAWHTEYSLLRTRGVSPSGWDQVAQTLMTGLDFAF